MHPIAQLIENIEVIPVFAIVLVAVWSLVWKSIALWKSARKGSLPWFVALSIINTMGILEILYIFIFSKMKPARKATKARKKRR